MKHGSRVKSRAQVRAEFRRAGVSIADWARQHKVPAGLVYEVLSDRSKRRCVRGASHRVAVLLGLKQGEIAANVDVVNAIRLPRAA